MFLKFFPSGFFPANTKADTRAEYYLAAITLSLYATTHWAANT